MAKTPTFKSNKLQFVGVVECVMDAERYAHAKQFKRMGRAIKRQRTIVARIARQLERGANAQTQTVRDSLQGNPSKDRLVQCLMMA